MKPIQIQTEETDAIPKFLCLFLHVKANINKLFMKNHQIVFKVLDLESGSWFGSLPKVHEFILLHPVTPVVPV